LYSDSRSAAARAAARRAVARFPGHDSRGLRHAAPLGVGTLAARMGPAHQKSDRRTSSDALLGFSRRRGKYAARSMAWQEQLGIAAAAAVALQRFAAAAAMSDFEVKPLASPARNTTMSSMHPGDTVVVLRARNRSQQPSCGPHPAAERIAAALQLQLQRYAAAPAEPCYELDTGRGGATRSTRHRMMLFCRTFGALVPCERQGCQH
jgi:hypothetical protein